MINNSDFSKYNKKISRIVYYFLRKKLVTFWTAYNGNLIKNSININNAKPLHFIIYYFNDCLYINKI